MIRVLHFQQRALMQMYTRGSVYSTRATARALPKFEALGLSSPLVQALSKTSHSLQIRTPTQIQTLGIPAALTGKVMLTNVLICFCELLVYFCVSIVDHSCVTWHFQHQNILLGSETGSGKTLCYLLPVLDKVTTIRTHDQIVRLAL